MTYKIPNYLIERVEQKIYSIVNSYNASDEELLAAAEFFKGLVEYQKSEKVKVLGNTK